LRKRKSNIDSIQKAAKAVMERSDEDTSLLQSQLIDLTTKWDKVSSLSATKQRQLNEAYIEVCVNCLDDVVNGGHGGSLVARWPASVVMWSVYSSDLRLDTETYIDSWDTTPGCFVYLLTSSSETFLYYELVTTLFHAFVASRVDYCNSVFDSAPKTVTDKLQLVLDAAAHLA